MIEYARGRRDLRFQIGSPKKWGGAGELGAIFLCLAILTLPFQQAFTLDVGFPLKACEVLGGLGVLLSIIGRRWPRRDSLMVWLVASLAIIVLLSSAINIFDLPFGLADAAYPNGVGFDLIQYTAYAVLALAFCIFLSTVDSKHLLWALAWAVRLTAIYALIQILMWSLDSDLLSYVNARTQIGTQYGIGLPRNGPMREGNYLGMFSVVSFFLMVFRRDTVGAVIALLLVGYTQSTGAMAALLVGLVLSVILRPSLRKMLILVGIAVVTAALAFAIPALNRLVRGQLTKLGLIENQFGDSYTYSLRHRTAQSDTAFAIGWDHPFIGVGQGRYAHYFDAYVDREGLPSNFGQNWTHPIANNVYAQISAETGLVALLVFIAILGSVLWTARRYSMELVGAVGALATTLIAFPAWTSLLMWGIIGVLLASISNERDATIAVAISRRARRSVESPRWGIEIVPKIRPVRRS